MRILIMSDKRLRRFLLTNKILRFSYFLTFSLKTIPCSTVLLVAIRHGRVCAELSFGERMRETLCMHSSSTVLLFLKKVWSKNQYIIHSISSMCLLFWRRHLHSSFSTLFCYALIEMLKRVLMSHWTIEAFFSPHLLRTYIVTKQFLSSSSSLSTIQCKAEEGRASWSCIEINEPLNIYELRIVPRNFISFHEFCIILD